MPNNFDRLFNQSQGDALINALKGIKSSLDVNYPLENINVNFSNTAQNITPSSNYYGIGQVNVPALNIVDQTILLNGQYDPVTSGYDGYGRLDVNVPNTYGASDEGKVVDSGALVTQTSQSISQNGTYDTTLNNEIVVNVEGGGGGTFCFVHVTYNVGGVCSMTNGTVVLEAEDTSGYYIFAIPTPEETPETWTIVVTYNGETATKDIEISEYGSAMNVRAGIDTIEHLKEDMAATEYTMLSTAVGDGGSEDGRWFTRQSANPPLIFLDFYYTTGYNGYGVISVVSDIGRYSNSSWGQLELKTTQTTPNGTVYYIYAMAGAWQNKYPTYTVDGETISRGDRRRYAYANENGIRGDSQYIDELVVFIDRLADILAKNA